MAGIVTKLEKKNPGSKDTYIFLSAGLAGCLDHAMSISKASLHAIFVCLDVLPYIYISISCVQMHKKAHVFMYSCTDLHWQLLKASKWVYTHLQTVPACILLCVHTCVLTSSPVIFRLCCYDLILASNTSPHEMGRRIINKIKGKTWRLI